MATVTLYRKYRPQFFKELKGQDHVCQTLTNSLKNSRVSHAYLFSGPRGVGKTSVARILAKAINCKNLKNGEPCNKCQTCQVFMSDKALDLIEIDAASNRGIDEIRDLKEKIKFSPSEGKFKVFIIDEVHMLTKEAFNALLKTLEEPPAHAIFILATTEIHKVPATIISRSQRFDFRRIKMKELVEQLKYIADQEKIKIENQALNLMAEKSEGSFRDAISLLDQIASFGEKKVTLKETMTILGIAEISGIEDFIVCLKDNNGEKGIKLINQLTNEGIDLHQFTKSLIEYLRQLLLLKVADLLPQEITEEKLTKMKDLASSLALKKILKAIEVLTTTEKEFRISVLPQLFLEVALTKLVTEDQKEISSFVESQEESKGDVIEQIKTPKIKETFTKQIKAINKENIDLNKIWPEILLDVKSKNHSLHAFLKVAYPKVEKENFILLFPYKFHKEKVEENKMIIEEVLDKFFGQKYVIRCIFTEKNNSSDNKKVLETLEILGGELVE